MLGAQRYQQNKSSFVHEATRLCFLPKFSLFGPTNGVIDLQEIKLPYFRPPKLRRSLEAVRHPYNTALHPYTALPLSIDAAPSVSLHSLRDDEPQTNPDAPCWMKVLFPARYSISDAHAADILSPHCQRVQVYGTE